MHIERHPIDAAFLGEVEASFESEYADLSNYLAAARRDPANLSLLARQALCMAGQASILNAPPSRIVQAIELAAEAHTALFAALAATSGSPVSVKLGPGDPATFTSAPDRSATHVGRWITGFYLNRLVGNREGVVQLCRVSPETLARSSTIGSGYEYQYMQALALLGSARLQETIPLLLSAVKGTDPNLPGIVDADWTLHVHVPQLEVLIYLITEDPKFGEGLARAVTLHKKYWSKGKLRRRDYNGYISIELSALAALGRDRGLRFEVDSPYLPVQLFRT